MHTLERPDTEAVSEVVDITKLLHEQKQMYMDMAKKKDIDLNISIPEKPVHASIDTNYLARVIDNLMSNAIKYTQKGKKVNLSLIDIGQTFQILIKDEGQGFSEEDKKKMFRKFQKLSAQPTAGESSTGLGLSIVKNLVEKLGGELAFESEQGRGSAFQISFATEQEKTAKDTKPVTMSQ